MSFWVLNHSKPRCLHCAVQNQVMAFKSLAVQLLKQVKSCIRINDSYVPSSSWKLGSRWEFLIFQPLYLCPRAHPCLNRRRKQTSARPARTVMLDPPAASSAGWLTLLNQCFWADAAACEPTNMRYALVAVGLWELYIPYRPSHNLVQQALQSQKATQTQSCANIQPHIITKSAVTFEVLSFKVWTWW